MWRNCGFAKIYYCVLQDGFTKVIVIVTKYYLLRKIVAKDCYKSLWEVYESDNYCDEILFIAKDCYKSLREVYESDNYCDEILFIAKELFIARINYCEGLFIVQRILWEFKMKVEWKRKGRKKGRLFITFEKLK